MEQNKIQINPQEVVNQLLQQVAQLSEELAYSKAVSVELQNKIKELENPEEK